MWKMRILLLGGLVVLVAVAFVFSTRESPKPVPTQQPQASAKPAAAATLSAKATPQPAQIAQPGASGATRLATVAGGLGAGASSGQLPVESWPHEVLTREPRYASKNPRYITLELGNAKDRFITAVLDESKGTNKGYDTLYVDTNNNGDLTDDARPVITVQKQGPMLMLNAASVPVTVRYHDGATRKLNVNIEGRAYSMGRETHWMLSYTLASRLKGQVDFGGKKVLLAICDASRDQYPGNGCFDDFRVDRLRIDQNGDGKLVPAEEIPLSNVVSYGGKLWNLSVDSAGARVFATPCEKPTGRVAPRSSFAAGTRVLAGSTFTMESNTGRAFACSLSTAGAGLVPAGEYRLGGGQLKLADKAGTKWEATFSLNRRPVTVAAGNKPTVLKLGAPIRVEPVIQSQSSVARPGEQLSVSYRLIGAGNEVYAQNIHPVNIARPPPPTVVVTDAAGARVAGGKMEYG